MRKRKYGWPRIQRMLFHLRCTNTGLCRDCDLSCALWDATGLFVCLIRCTKCVHTKSRNPDDDSHGVSLVQLCIICVDLGTIDHKNPLQISKSHWKLSSQSLLGSFALNRRWFNEHLNWLTSFAAAMELVGDYLKEKNTNWMNHKHQLANEFDVWANRHARATTDLVKNDETFYNWTVFDSFMDIH